MFLICARHVLTFWLGSHGFCMFDPPFVAIGCFCFVFMHCLCVDVSICLDNFGGFAFFF